VEYPAILLHKQRMTCQHNYHGDCVKTALAQAEALCATKGLRFTDQRRQVFQLLWSSHKALTAGDIMDVLGRDQPPLTYRALDFLTEQKLIHHIASVNAYIGCTHPAQNHISQLFVCEQCRDVTETDASPSVQSSLKNNAQKNGFAMHRTFIEVLGLCATCQS
jgi:Fur family zinc uptake transcriptional regulator